MAGFRLPKANAQETRIDLTEYGGEGFLSVHKITAGDSWALNEYIKKLAKEDGIKCESDKDIANLSSNQYKFQSLIFIISRLTYGVDGDVQKNLTDEDVLNLPPELITKIVEVIDEGANFPLAQTAGTGQK